MKKYSFALLFLGGTWLLAAPPQTPAAAGKDDSTGRISAEQLLDKDKLMVFTSVKPCWLDKYKYFCCPVKKIVRRKDTEGKWADYCYNAKEELIGIRKSDHRGTVKRSDFTTVTGCSQCRSTLLKQKSWRHNTRPQLAPAKKKKKR